MSGPSTFRATASYDRVRLPVERLVEKLEDEGREMEAQAVRNLLFNHQCQRVALASYARHFAALSARLNEAVTEAA